MTPRTVAVNCFLKFLRKNQKSTKSFSYFCGVDSVLHFSEGLIRFLLKKPVSGNYTLVDMSPEPAKHEENHAGDAVPPEKKKGVKDFTHFGIPKPAIEAPANGPFEKNRQWLYEVVDRPVRWIRETVIEPIQAKNKHPYYHRKFARAPTIDECGEGDLGCYFEANEQYKRDKEVDSEILKIIRKRRNDCIAYERDDWAANCVDAMEEYETSVTNYFMRYGEVGHFSSCVDVYMRQKHRMIWERRFPEKVDFMHAKERQERGYIVPVAPGFAQSPTFPDNSRAQIHVNKEFGTGGSLISDPDSPQDASKHYKKAYNTGDHQGKFAP